MIQLTNKKELFCNEYIINFNATNAALKAGYSEKTAYSQGNRLLKNVEVLQRIEELKTKRNKRLEITQDDVVKNLIQAAKIAIGEETTHVVATTKEGILTNSVKKTDLNNFVKVQDLLMKHLGGYEKDNQQRKTDLSIDLSSLSTEELIERAKSVSQLKHP